jgi:hypothetical protein
MPHPDRELERRQAAALSPLQKRGYAVIFRILGDVALRHHEARILVVSQTGSGHIDGPVLSHWARDGVTDWKMKTKGLKRNVTGPMFAQIMGSCDEGATLSCFVETNMGIINPETNADGIQVRGYRYDDRKLHVLGQDDLRELYVHWCPDRAKKFHPAFAGEASTQEERLPNLSVNPHEVLMWVPRRHEYAAYIELATDGDSVRGAMDEAAFIRTCAEIINEVGDVMTLIEIPAVMMKEYMEAHGLQHTPSGCGKAAASLFKANPKLPNAKRLMDLPSWMGLADNS